MKSGANTIMFFSKLWKSQKTKESEKELEKSLFEARRAWLSGDHSDDNLWANWKFEEANKIKDPHCGSFEYWYSISTKGSRVENMVTWAEIVLWKANLKPSYAVVGGYVKSNGTSVSSHLRKI
jgi:hypothetical protein